MRHSYFGKRLSRTKNERQQLFRNLSRAMIRHGAIVTSITKAKAVQPMIEKLITKAKIGTEQKRREVFAILADSDSTKALMEMARTRFAKRTSGFTRIVKMGPRQGDATEQAQLMFVDEAVVAEVVTSKTEPKKEVKPSPKKVPAKPKTKTKSKAK